MQRPDEPAQRGWRFETFEERLAFTAQPVADFWIDVEPFAVASEPSAAFIEPLSASGQGWSDVAAARDDFGLRGNGQTVAIIDSGIAYDHVALGGGLGKAHRVVGGWDFAENDADPYDDGPAGFHGTHVAGIVGARGDRYAGIAPGADLLALRVFDDQGLGQLTWVEQALRWVHQNRTAFDNPITTVNLSLGTDWNSSSLPKWATLEDELKQLADSGIFISVAAGNSFLVYNAPGLSYPGVSQYVTPVASVDASGSLSRFSQRHDRVLAAPGERIMSTLPDHFYGGDGYKNDWGATSGTSMASPYVAGASVLLREAMDHLGLTNVTQTTLYDHFRETADAIYDSVTRATYHRLNLERALETLVGADDFGSTAAEARQLGSLGETITVSGTIGRVNDEDFFQFTAAATGTATLTLDSPQHLAAVWKQTGSQGRLDGDTLTLDVVAGQSYVVGVAGGGVTIGRYGIEMRLEAAPRGETNQNEARVTIADGIASVLGTDGDDTIRWQAGVQQTLLVNGVSHTLTGVSQVRIDGRGGHDTLELVGGGGRETVNLRPGSAELFGPGYRVIAESVEATVAVGDYRDRVWMFDSAGNDTFIATPQSARLVGTGYDNRAEGFGVVVAVGSSGGIDTARLYDSAGGDILEASPTSAKLRGTGFSNEARDFEQIIVDASTGGFDFAALRGSQGRDELDASASFAWLRGSGYSVRAEAFESLHVQATPGGGDVARFVGTSANDVLSVWSGTRTLTGGGVQIRTDAFQHATFYGGNGTDRVDFYTANATTRLTGQADRGAIADELFATEFANVESLLATVRRGHDLQTDLAAVDFAFRKFGRG